MSSVLDRPGLEKSPLADLHLLASELGVENFRRLRKADLIDAILDRQSGVETGTDDADADAEAAEAAAPRRPRPPPPRPPRRRGARARDADDGKGRSRRGRRGARTRARPRTPTTSDGGREAATATAGDRNGDGGGEDKLAEGVVELLANGSGFVRLAPPDPTDDDVYISAAQVKRCELVSGDRVGGPVRAPRRSERFPSLVRVDTINGRPADEVAEGTRFEDLPAAFPAERFELGSDDPTVKAIEWLTPFGKGSRVVIAGAARSGKSEALQPDRRRPGRPRRPRGQRRAGRRAPRGGRRVGRRSGRAGRLAVLRRLARRAGPGRRAGDRAGPPRRGPRRRRRRARRHARVPRRRRGPPRARRGPQHRRRRLADRDRHRGRAARRRDHRGHARRHA